MNFPELHKSRSEAFEGEIHPVICKGSGPVSVNNRGPDASANDFNPLGTRQNPESVFATLLLLQIRQGLLEDGENVSVKRLALQCHAAGYEADAKS